MHSVTLFRTRKTLHSRLDLDRIDSETLRKLFKSVIYAG